MEDMEESTPKSPTPPWGLQEYLSAGYVYLIFLGIIDEVIFYSFFEIDILNYSGISDILMAPINTLLSDIRVFGMISAILFLAYLMYFKVLPYLHQKSKSQQWYQKMVRDMDKADAKFAYMQKSKVLFIGIYMSCLFLGLRIGYGYKMQDRVDKGQFKLTHSLTMTDNSEKKVRIIGQNSLYVFYVTKEKRSISIIPISGNIKEIQHLTR
ncbi:hypothetical protein Halhy_0912 [Haliscomenobacter hydrossis DSM 1100]|uniref:Uncharacterized protein n=2 Tax=Haliscomenobacter TaxID=2349 RepID=F4L6D1_HALH1|nr:hypothetical protein Halhy_0912 [Haliscomenobacter hydrossis DSM 1100]